MYGNKEWKRASLNLHLKAVINKSRSCPWRKKNNEGMKLLISCRSTRKTSWDVWLSITCDSGGEGGFGRSRVGGAYIYGWQAARRQCVCSQFQTNLSLKRVNITRVFSWPQWIYNRLYLVVCVCAVSVLVCAMPNDTELSHPILLVSLPMPKEDRSRSVSPHSTSSSVRELRGIRLFRAISRRLSRKSRRYEDESTDSSSSEGHSDSGSGNNSPDCMKDASDSTLRKVLNTFNLANDRRSSDSNSDISSTSSSRKKSSTSSTPKKILRQPVSYTYVRGLSGLPTIRVPRTSACCSQTCCRCHTPGCGR